MNPKLMAWALAVSVAGNVASVGWWVRGRASEAGSAAQVGRYTFTQQGASVTRCDTMTGRVEVAAVVNGKLQLLEVISAQNPPIVGGLPLREP
jgi:hypothetical protein